MPTPFIDTQFPLEILSLESYKERKANLGQTLTGLGKWWGRKPLILVRACILGLLLPAGEDPKRDREIFLKILTMDEDGLWRRKNKKLSAKDILGILGPEACAGKVKIDTGRWTTGLSDEEKEALEKTAFARLSYQEKLASCARPEEIDGPSPEAWKDINAHLGTDATSLVELFDQLSTKTLGHKARVGDVFCGGGSIPFEAARLGLEAWGSDLNPVAALLTWASIHLIGGGAEAQKEVKAAQESAWKAADKQITAWGIEHDGKGNRADAYLYCVEAKSPATGLWVPLAPSWVIGERTKTIALLKKNQKKGNYDIEIISDATEAQIAAAKKGSVQSGELVCPETGSRYSISGIRGDRRGAEGTEYGLRLWENEDLVPRPEDVFQERLYCVRWVTPEGQRVYKSVTEEDLTREAEVLTLLKERFTDWQEKGYIPSKKIVRGYNTEQPVRERGWTHWHHLFNPRQLLVYGLLANFVEADSMLGKIGLLSNGRMADYSARLTKWAPQIGYEITTNVFSNQALNTVYNFGVRGLMQCENSFFLRTPDEKVKGSAEVKPLDARDVTWAADYWITDPPYADAVNYHELADFFLAWYEKQLPKLFPDWSAEGRSALAVRGEGENFKKSMVEIYANLAAHMNPEGRQIVMFTHQDSGVWADLGMILWASGLQVTAAWTIGTETSSGLKEGNYVQGTVCLVLRKRQEERTIWNDELIPLVDDEVRRQMEHMRAVDDADRPQFGDTDYQLGAYAAALTVLTGYSGIEGMDITHELFRSRARNEKSPFQKIIDRAVSIAAGYLVPRGLDAHVWRGLSSLERLYLRGLELERHGEARQGAYQELARGFGVEEYRFLLAEAQANQARFKTPTEFKKTMLSDGVFGATILRHLLYAIHETARAESPREGLNYLKAARPDYWDRRADLLALCFYLQAASAHAGQAHWEKDALAAELLGGLMQGDYVGSQG